MTSRRAEKSDFIPLSSPARTGSSINITFPGRDGWWIGVSLVAAVCRSSYILTLIFPSFLLFPFFLRGIISFLQPLGFRLKKRPRAPSTRNDWRPGFYACASRKSSWLPVCAYNLVWMRRTQDVPTANDMFASSKATSFRPPPTQIEFPGKAVNCA